MKLDVQICRPDIWPIAVQGPRAETLMARVFGDEVYNIRFFRYKRLQYRGHEFIVARSGWSAQGGFEIYIDDVNLGQALWDELFVVGADLNVGHGCPNNIERMEAGLLSFGSAMDYSHTPLKCGLDRYCHLDADLPSMSLDALRAQRERGVPSRLVGVVAEHAPLASRFCQLLVDGRPVGDITSQTLSARYDAWLCFVYLESDMIDTLKNGSAQLHMQYNNESYAANLCELPFKLAEKGLAERIRHA